MKPYMWKFLDEDERPLAGGINDRYYCKKVTGHCVFFAFSCRDLVVFDGFSVCVKEGCLRMSLLSASAALRPRFCCTLYTIIC